LNDSYMVNLVSLGVREVPSLGIHEFIITDTAEGICRRVRETSPTPTNVRRCPPDEM
jgi:hypothetical protein